MEQERGYKWRGKREGEGGTKIRTKEWMETEEHPLSHSTEQGDKGTDTVREMIRNWIGEKKKLNIKMSSPPS